MVPTKQIFEFPNPVNEYAARSVAAGVAILTLVYLASSSIWVLAFIAYGFLARVLTGPSLSPLGQLATRVAAPQIERVTGAPGPRVAGPPKRFAQGIGLTLSTVAVLLHVSGFSTAAGAVVAMITVAATLEAAVALCIGCKLFAGLMSLGLIPEATCVECADISARLARS